MTFFCKDPPTHYQISSEDELQKELVGKHQAFGSIDFPLNFVIFKISSFTTHLYMW